MKKAIPYFSVLFLFIVVFVSFPSSIKACSCAQLPSVAEELKGSNAVFSGKVVKIRERRNIKGYKVRSVLFEVENTWKGTKQSQVLITTGLGGGDCGYDFTEGHEYLVYAHDSTMYGSKSLVTVICNRTNELSSSKEDLKILGEGMQPTEEVDLTRSPNKSLIYIWLAVFLVIGIIVIFLLKRKKRSRL